MLIIHLDVVKVVNKYEMTKHHKVKHLFFFDKIK